MTSAMSFSAMWLLTLKRAESWLYWIVVDVAGIYLYFTKGIAFVGLQYVALLGMATYAFGSWQRIQRKEARRVTDADVVTGG